MVEAEFEVLTAVSTKAGIYDRSSSSDSSYEKKMNVNEKEYRKLLSDTFGKEGERESYGT
jgi:hypothetical protein